MMKTIKQKQLSNFKHILGETQLKYLTGGDECPESHFLANPWGVITDILFGED